MLSERKKILQEYKNAELISSLSHARRCIIDIFFVKKISTRGKKAKNTTSSDLSLVGGKRKKADFYLRSSHAERKMLAGTKPGSFFFMPRGVFPFQSLFLPPAPTGSSSTTTTLPLHLAISSSHRASTLLFLSPK